MICLRRVTLVVAALIAAVGLQAALTGAAVAATPTGTTLSVDPPLPAEDLYVEDSGNNRAQKVPVAGGSPTTFRSGQLAQVAFDSAWDMFIAECENDQVSVIAANGEPEGTVGEELLCPYGVAVDAAGDVFILEQESHETNLSGGQIVEVPEGFGILTGPRQGLTGRRLTYEITVTNGGDATATKTTLSSRLKGAGAQGVARVGKACHLDRATCELGSLAPGKKVKIDVTAVARRAGRLTLAATVRSSGAATDHARATTTISRGDADR